MTNVSVQDLEALIEQFRRNEWREMHLRVGDVELFLSADGIARLPQRVRESSATPASTSTALVAAPGTATSVAAPSCAVNSHADKLAAEVPLGWIQIRAPSLGSFYRAPNPGAPPFADIGARVSPESELCVIEVMKLFTTMRAGVAGVVREVYSKDGDLVEYDQPLFLIEPDA